MTSRSETLSVPREAAGERLDRFVARALAVDLALARDLVERVAERLRGAALVAVALDTGRTHQIRVQLAEAGFPVLGDAVYGVPSPAIGRQALHAARLAFPAPTGGATVEVRAELPEDLAAAIESLR